MEFPVAGGVPVVVHIEVILGLVVQDIVGSGDREGIEGHYHYGIVRVLRGLEHVQIVDIQASVAVAGGSQRRGVHVVGPLDRTGGQTYRQN